jgi:Flp pilus assembly protein TadG
MAMFQQARTSVTKTKFAKTKLAKLMPRLRVRTVRRLVRNQSGAAAVEFSFVAIPFFMLMFAILETSLVFFAGQTMQTAVTDAARMIMTGQANKFEPEAFKTEVCNRIQGMFNCTNAYVDVRTFPSFSAISLPKPVNGSGAFDSSMLSYTKSAAGDVVVVRVFYKWPVFLSLYGFNLADLPDNNRLLSGAAAFKNEPF